MIKINDKMPDATLLEMQDGAPNPVALAPLLAGKKVALFAVPGAFTGTCSKVHVPSYITAMPDLKAKGVDAVICVSGNDPWVMEAWGKETGGAEAGIRFLGDPSGALARDLGLAFEAPGAGFFNRYQRFSMLIEDGVVTSLNVEENLGVCEKSGGDALAGLI